MREKKPTVVFTFYTTAAAMAMEKLCKTRGLPGRLGPTPRSVTSDCGIAWLAPLGDRAVLESAPGAPEFAGIYEREL